ncbi:MAG: glycosyltransferase family 39 protein [Candidatus Chisholmbacteria bacterium]|nr:glycosyltransferase family 39 protein [Candidatus Chisholmbacteria bacterium]
MKFFRQPEKLLLIAILLIAAFFRLYKVPEYIVFLGDEGRDLIVVRNILKGDLTLLGPTASVGGFYLGPIYYYMMAPFLLLFNYNPAGPAYLVSLFGIATVYLVYLFGKRFFHPIVGLVAAFLYAISPLIVRYSRASWNPNPLSFFALGGIFILSLGLTKKRRLYLYLAGACLGVAWQLHYLALILTAVYTAILSQITTRKKWLDLKFSSQRIKEFFRHNLIVFLGFVTTFSPFLLFEIRHLFPNTKTVIEFMTRQDGALDTPFLAIFTTAYERISRLFIEALSLPRSPFLIGVVLVAFLSLFYASRRRNKSLLIWLVVGILSMSVYQGDIHDYYFGFLFPVPFLMVGITAYLLWIKGWGAKIIVALGLIILTGSFIDKAFFSRPPNNLIRQTELAAEVVLDLSGGEPYNFALMSTGNSDHAYRYFLETSANPPKKLEEEVTPQLILICEQDPATCQPLSFPSWEVAGFGRREVVETRTAPPGLITVIKTVHHESSLDMIGKPAPKGS